MEIASKYSPGNAEDRWYKYWMEKGFFKSTPDEREPYTIVIPPPNVTGVLHMGHMLNNTIQDILIRRARMLGKNACWVPGTDHASIATEAKVVGKLRDEGIKKSDISRDEFLGHAWEWTEKHGGIILEQLKKLGASCDWDRTAFTMNESLSESVIRVFVDLYNKGYIYRGVRMVNWDPQAKTAVSDEEVIYKEEQSKLYYLRYQVEGSDDYVTIATTRPETILGDTAVCVNPADERFTDLVGKKVIVPLVNRPVPVIQDSYVDMEFGTGCLKITPAHDENDYEIGQRHKLDTIDIFTEDGILNEAAEILVGTDRFEARKLIIPMLEEAGSLEKTEDYLNKLGYSERTDVVIEPRLSAQWFIAMKELARPALDHVMNDDIKFHPPKFKNVYKHWMENVKDWCISRQLWWGHRIPVYYLENGEYVVAETDGKALELAREKSGNSQLSMDQLKQEEDVLDTWASSWLWPISVFNGINDPDNQDINYYYPTSDLVTAPDIIFFWVARMIIAGYEYRGDKPFGNVYFTGMVRDKLRRKMSKSLGNSPDPLDLIAQYGADGVRVGMLLCSPAGNDILFDEALTEQGRNFCNKLWNTFRLIKGWEVDPEAEQSEAAREAIRWFDNKLNQSLELIDDHFSKFRISDALMTVYTLVRDEFSAWFLEAVKPPYQQGIDQKTYKSTSCYLEKLLKALHPFMPFISEEIYQLLKEREEGESIMISAMPEIETYKQSILENFEETKEVITAIRKIRQEKALPQKDMLHLRITAKEGAFNREFLPLVHKLANIEEISFVEQADESDISFMVKTTEYSIPLGDLIDSEAEKAKLEEELKYHQGFLNSVMKKLDNASFVNNAPENVVAAEMKKKADAEEKIKTLKDRINILR
ncbi:MAG: valine--tRNA ligase [Bacteroidales bacterium]|nr:valine--tRNA ligase [Bacteroidales bacterium]